MTPAVAATAIATVGWDPLEESFVASCWLSRLLWAGSALVDGVDKDETSLIRWDRRKKGERVAILDGETRA